MATLPLVPTDEEAALRESVAGICSRFGPKYMRECNAEEKPPTELWEALADKGYLGANLPEEYGGGGLGRRGLAGGGAGVWGSGRRSRRRAPRCCPSSSRRRSSARSSCATAPRTRRTTGCRASPPARCA